MSINWGKYSWLPSLVSTIALCCLPGTIEPVLAAETVIVRRGSFTQSVTVAQLKAIAESGTVPDNLQDYARTLTSIQKAKIRSALQENLSISAEELAEFLHTSLGVKLVGFLAEINPIHDQRDTAVVEAALNQATKSPQGLSIISFIEAYPQQELEIDLGRAFLVLGNFNGAFWQTQAFMAAIAPQLMVEDPQKLTLPFDPSQPGTAPVQILEKTFVDAQGILPSGSRRDRSVPVTIYWSEAASAQKPLIVYSHGLGSINTDLHYLGEHLASHGYVFVAVEHTGSNFAYVKEAVVNWLVQRQPLLSPEEFLHRPQDIRFVLDQLTAMNQSPGELEGKLATDQVLMIGYSFGGSTALSLAGAELQIDYVRENCLGQILALNLGENAQCFAQGLPGDRYQLRDERVKAAIALSPTAYFLFGTTGMEQVAVPTIITTASADKTTPALTEQVIPFNQMPPPKGLAAFIGGTHLSVKDPSATRDQVYNPDTLYTGGEIVDDQAVEVRNYIKAMTLAMAAQLTDEAAKYAIFLTPEYARFASTQRMPMLLITEIPVAAQEIIKEIVPEFEVITQQQYQGDTQAQENSSTNN